MSKANSTSPDGLYNPFIKSDGVSSKLGTSIVGSFGASSVHFPAFKYISAVVFGVP